MSSRAYVWEKLFVAIDCMCGDGTFMDRLKDATISSLIRLDSEDLDGDLGADLDYILSWTKNNMLDGEFLNIPDEIERSKLIKKMMSVMLETHEK